MYIDITHYIPKSFDAKGKNAFKVQLAVSFRCFCNLFREFMPVLYLITMLLSFDLVFRHLPI